MYSPLICQLDVWQVSNIFPDFVAPPRHLLSQHCTMFRLIMWSKSPRQQIQVFSFLLLSIVSILFPANCSQLCNKTSPIKTLLILLSLVYSHGIYMLLLSSIDWKKVYWGKNFSAEIFSSSFLQIFNFHLPWIIVGVCRMERRKKT